MPGKNAKDFKMMKVGLISDTHGYFDPELNKFFDDRDEIWHAGDFGSQKVAASLQKMAPVIGVYGNVDGADIRNIYPKDQHFNREGLKIWMTHIGGKPGRYCLPVREELEKGPPDIFICGHSHILKISRDKEKNNMLYMNPGAAGKQGLHKKRTIVRFDIDEGKLSNVEVIELGDK